MNEQTAIAIVIPIMTLCATYVLVSILNGFVRARRDRHLADLQVKLIDRLGAGPDVMNYLSSDAVKNLLASEPEGKAPYVTRVLNTIQTASVLLCAGAGMMAVSGMADEARQFLKVTGGILVAI